MHHSSSFFWDGPGQRPFNKEPPAVVPAANLLKSKAICSEPISGQVFEHFFDSLTSFLQISELGQPVLLSKVASSASVQLEWARLQQNHIISKTTQMKEVILQRPERFKISSDPCNQLCVQLIGARNVSNAFLEAAAAIQSAVSKGANGSAITPCSSTQDASGQAEKASYVRLQAGSSMQCPKSVQPLSSRPNNAITNCRALRPEQISAIEALLRKSGGREKLSKIGSQFGVKKLQLASHFTLVPCGTDCLVVLGSSPGKSTLKGIATATIDRLDHMLSRAVLPSRHVIRDIMAFCIDNTEHAAPLSRRLAVTLGEKGLSNNVAITRLYIISDIIMNATCGQPEADRFSTCFQDLLPEAFEQLGREWFRRIESHSERSDAERRIRHVLAVWRQNAFFTPLFTYGLESLLFAPVLEDANMNPSLETDPKLRHKMTRWFSAADQVRLPSACRIRGLSGRALSTTSCRSRLCHFERFWHRPGIAVFEDADLYGDEIPVCRTPIRASSAAPIVIPPSTDSMESTNLMDIDSKSTYSDGDAIDLDGELLTDEDLAAMEHSLDGEVSQRWRNVEKDGIAVPLEIDTE